MSQTSLFQVRAVVRPNENGYLMQYAWKEMRAQVKDFPWEQTLFGFHGVRSSYASRVMEVSLSPSISPLYLLRDALNRNVLQVNGDEAEQCLRILIWRSAIGIVIFFPDLPSLKYLFSQLLGELPANRLQFSAPSGIASVWRAVLSKSHPCLRQLIFIMGYKGTALLAHVRTTLWGHSSFRARMWVKRRLSLA